MSEKVYYPTIGLEIHAELKTKTKMFCACKNDADEDRPNVNICPVCMAHPGTLPVINKEAVRQVLRVGTAVGGRLALDFTEFDRKNYFYPDIPKGYQLSQYKFPLVSGGNLNGVELTRIHLEEDTGTSLHESSDGSLINYNRAGVPLMELVTEPVIKSAKQAADFAKELQLLLRLLGASEANMEKGEMRIEANISVSTDPNTFGTKVEVKNLNSFKSVERAIAIELERHINLLESGKTITQETRGFDENKGITFLQREKENAHDYRYFPDPDLPKLKLGGIAGFSAHELKQSLPKLPSDRRKELLDFGIKLDFIEIFLQRKEIYELVDASVEAFKNDKPTLEIASNYIATDVLSIFDKKNLLPKPEVFVELISLIKQNKISSRGAKDLLAIIVSQSGGALELAQNNNLLQVSDSGALKKIVEKIVSENNKVVEEYKAGKEASLQFLIGQGMKESRGSANPQTLKELFVETIKNS